MKSREQGSKPPLTNYKAGVTVTLLQSDWVKVLCCEGIHEKTKTLALMRSAGIALGFQIAACFEIPTTQSNGGIGRFAET